MVTEVYKSVIDIVRQKKFVVGVGGEHTISLPLAKACFDVYGHFTVVVIDAHLDLRNNTDDYETVKMDAGPEFGRKPGDLADISEEYAHSTVMRRIHQIGNDISLFQIGIRSEDQSEFEYAEANRETIKVFRWPFWGNHCDIVDEIRTPRVYLSIDVDGFNPSVMPATGTTEEGGISWDWFMQFAKTLFRKKEVIGMDVVEVAQGKNFSVREAGSTAYNAAKIIYRCIGMKFRK
jgi:agmatinase